MDDLAPIQEQQFIQNGKIYQMLVDWVEAVSRGVQKVYENTIRDNATTSEYHSLFGNGVWVQAKFTQSLQNNILQNLLKIVTHKAIKRALQKLFTQLPA